MKTKVIVIRHAEAAGNKERFFQGSIDGKVSEKGYLQLDALAERMKDIKFDAIYSSPLSRARETAEAANRYAQLPMNIDERLVEINGGVWEGVPWKDIPKKFIIQGINWVRFPWRFAPKNGEKMTECYKRISSAVLDIAAKHEGQTVVIVSHGCSIRNLICFAKGLSIKHLNEINWCDNTALNEIEIENGRMTLISECDNAHLTAVDLSTIDSQKWWKKNDLSSFDD